MRATAVRIRYDHISQSWRGATPERRADLVGELELLSLQLPVEPSQHDGQDGVATLRAEITELITTIGLTDAD